MADDTENKPEILVLRSRWREVPVTMTLNGKIELVSVQSVDSPHYTFSWERETNDDN